MARNTRNLRNPANPQSDLFRALTRLFSGPIIMIVPFYRKKFSSEVHYISEKEYNGMIASQAHLTHDTVGGKCPYTHFKKTLGKLFS